MTSDKSYATEQRLNTLIGNLRGLVQDANGILRYNDVSGNALEVGTTRLSSFANTTINQNTPQGLGMTYTVVSGQSYRIQGMFFMAQGAAASQQFAGWTGPATSFVRIGISFGNTTTNAQNAWTNVTSLGASLFGFTPAIGNGIELFYYGTITFSAGGTFQPYGQCSNAANTFTMQSGTCIDIAMI